MPTTWTITDLSVSPPSYTMAATDTVALTFDADEAIIGATASLIRLDTLATVIGAISSVVAGADNAVVTVGGLIAGVTYQLSVQFTRANSTVWTRVLIIEVTSPNATAGAGTTRAELRRTIANQLGDYYPVVATQSGQTGNMFDNYNLAGETNKFKGMQVLVTGGTYANLGQITTVTLSDEASRSISFEPPLPIATQVGDTAELYNFKSRGSTIQQYNQAINTAILQAREQHAVIPYTYTATDSFIRTNPYIDIPDYFTHIVSVDALDARGATVRLKAGDTMVDRFSRSIEVHRRGVNSLHGLSVRLRGYVAPNLLNNDTDRTNLDAEWILNEVKAQLLERRMAAGEPVGQQDRLFLQERNEASAKRAVILTRVAPNTIRLQGGGADVPQAAIPTVPAVPTNVVAVYGGDTA